MFFHDMGDCRSVLIIITKWSLISFLFDLSIDYKSFHTDVSRADVCEDAPCWFSGEPSDSDRFLLVVRMRSKSARQPADRAEVNDKRGDTRGHTRTHTGTHTDTHGPLVGLGWVIYLFALTRHSCLIRKCLTLNQSDKRVGVAPTEARDETSTFIQKQTTTTNNNNKQQQTTTMTWNPDDEGASVWLCVHVCPYVCVNVCACTSVWCVSIYEFVWLCFHMCVCLCDCVSMCVCTSVRLCVHIWVCVIVFPYVCACTS